MCGIHLSRTTPHHPAPNGLVEQLHHTLKSAIMCHVEEQWTEALPLVLLGIRTTYKEDLQSSAGELVYGEHLRVPSELLVPAAPKVEASTFIQQLRCHMDQLGPTPAARHASPATFIHKDLQDSTHVFLRHDAARRALEPPYSGKHKVIARTDKTLTIVVRDRQVKVSADQVKPAYILEGTQHDTGSPVPQRSSGTCYHDNSASKDHSLRAHCTLPGSVQHLSSLLRGGVMWGHPHRGCPSSVHFSAIQYSNALSSISVCNSSLRSQLQTKRNFPTQHLSKSIHSTSHAYQICQLTNGRVG